MMLVVTSCAERTELYRREYARLHCFVHCATYQNFIHSAEKYAPDVILLEVLDAVSEKLVQKMQRIREILPDIALIVISDVDTASLAPDLKYSLRVQAQTLQFQAMYFSPRSKYASLKPGSLIISGLFLVPSELLVFLCGQLAPFSPEEVFLLRYLAENHPRRIGVEELGRCCFTYGKRTSRSTVASRISRINAIAKKLISVPIITNRRGEGYGIDF